MTPRHELPEQPNKVCAWCGTLLGWQWGLPDGVLSHGICRWCSHEQFHQPFQWLDSGKMGKLLAEIRWVYFGDPLLTRFFETVIQANGNPNLLVDISKVGDPPDQRLRTEDQAIASFQQAIRYLFAEYDSLTEQLLDPDYIFGEED